MDILLKFGAQGATQAAAAVKKVTDAMNVFDKRTGASGFFSRVAGGFHGAGGLGGLPGGTILNAAITGGAAGVIGGVVGVAAMSLASAFSAAAREALQMGDYIADTAEQIRSTPTDILKLRQAAMEAGMSEQKMIRGLQGLEAQRSAALGGDEKAGALFARFGISKATLGDEKTSAIQIGQAIGKSLGSSGVLRGDVSPLTALFGRNAENQLKVIQAMEAAKPKLTDEDISRIDRVNKALERLQRDVVDSVGGMIAELQTFFDRPKGVKDKSSPFWGGWRYGFDPSVEMESASLFKFGDHTKGESISADRTASMTTPEVEKALKATSYSQAQGNSAGDILARIGLFRAGMNPQLDAANRQIALQQSQLRELRSLNTVLNRAVTDDFPFAAP